jgi:hypothetical protein
MKIEDGKGTGRLAEVDENQRLQVSAVASDRAESANIDREAFIQASDIQLIGAAAEHKTIFIKNGESGRDMVIDIEKIFFDGGTTSNTKPLFMKIYLNASDPATNFESKDPLGLNTATGQSSTVFNVWDGVATGFTQASPGDLLSDFIVMAGATDIRIPSKLIIGPAKSLTYSFECEEACKVALQVYTHFL